MNVVHNRSELRRMVDAARALNKKVGLVPTMGALHRGHASLIEEAKQECDLVVVSVFVNPSQFGPTEDFARYPRTLEADAGIGAQAGAHVLYAPPEREIYPEGFNTWIEVEGVSSPLCGEFRPGHFRGVATVVHQLFQVVNPSLAYFGLKDLQQCLVIRKLVHDLYLPVTLRFCPTVRDADGLALSSRNAYLAPEDREAALVVPKAIQAVRAAYDEGERNRHTLMRVGIDVCKRESRFQVQYLDVRTLPDLAESEEVLGPAACAIAGFLGKTRLIDNCLLGVTTL